MGYNEQSTARARVTFTVEADAGSTWGHNCTTQQIYDQAAREATNALENVLHEGGKRIRAKIIGKPTVVAVFATPDTRAGQTAREPEPVALTVEDAMRAAHPAAGSWIDTTKAALDAIHTILLSNDKTPKGIKYDITEVLKNYGYKFDA